MQKYRSLFLSDIHLGSIHCKSEALFELLENVRVENLFLVGDIITQNAKASHPDIVRFKELINSRDWNIVYILGNHEKERKAKQVKLSTTNIFKTYNAYVYDNGQKRIYLTHGDIFHQKDIFQKLLKLILVKVKKSAQKIETKRKTHTASTLYHLKIKPFLQKILHNAYLEYMTSLAKKHDAQVVICGHIHLPERIVKNQIIYLNCGDWINHTSFIAEDEAGKFHLIAR